VVDVSWHEAMAYCKWLGEKINQPVTLPSEAEWERAARGDTDQRAYPWGDAWKELHCNSDALGLNDTTPVGLFLNGASPYGLLDMSGNVWEWTHSIWDDKFKYPYKTGDGREDLRQEGALRVLRGGAFRYESVYARCAYRRGHDPYGGYRDHGFRVCVVVFSSR